MVRASTMFAGSLLVALLTAGCFLNVTSYVDEEGRRVYVGEVFNQGEPIAGPGIEGKFYDANGNLITTQEGDVCQVLPKNGVSPFEVVLPAGTAQPARVEWTLTGDRVDNAYLAEGLTGEITATIDQVDLAGFGGGTYFYGEIKNNSANTYSLGYVCAAWKNDRGEVIRTGNGRAVHLRFGPGDTNPFEMLIPERLPGGITNVSLYFDAGVTPAGETPTTYVDLPDSAYTPGVQLGGPVQGKAWLLESGEIRNTTSQTIIPVVAAVIRDSSGRVQAAGSSESFCRVAIKPGETTFTSFSVTISGSEQPDPDLSIQAAVMPPDIGRFVLDVTDEDFDESSDGTVVSGTIENTSDTTLFFVNACAGVYDDGGDLIGAFPLYPDVPADGLAPGETIDVSESIPVFGEPAEVSIIADGIE